MDSSFSFSLRSASVVESVFSVPSSFFFSNNFTSKEIPPMTKSTITCGSISDKMGQRKRRNAGGMSAVLL